MTLVVGALLETLLLVALLLVLLPLPLFLAAALLFRLAVPRAGQTCKKLIILHKKNISMMHNERKELRRSKSKPRF